MTTFQTGATTSDLQRELDVLEKRLRDGEQRIIDARAHGADVQAWEAFWLELLHTYEAMFDQFQRVNGHPTQMAA